MNPRFFLFLLCSFSLYGSEKFPEPTEKFLKNLQQHITSTPSPEALKEVGTIHAIFRSSEHRMGRRLCCYAAPCVCLAPVGGSLCITATAGCTVGACCMIDSSCGCTDSYGYEFASLLATTHKARTAQKAPTETAKPAQKNKRK